MQIEVGLGDLEAQIAQTDQILVFRLLELITGSGDLGVPARVDQGPAGLQIGTHAPDIGKGESALLTRTRDAITELLATGVGGERTGPEIELGVPEGNLSPQGRLGLLDLNLQRLEIGIVDLGQGQSLDQTKGTKLPDHDLAGLVGQRQGQRRLQQLEIRRQNRGRRRQHCGIGMGTAPLQLGGQRQGLGGGILGSGRLHKGSSSGIGLGLGAGLPYEPWGGQGRHHQGHEQEMVMPHIQTRTMAVSLSIPTLVAET